MKKLLKYRYLWIAVILLAAVGACCLFPTSHKQSKALSSRVVVDASHLPAVVTVQGVRMSLNDVYSTEIGDGLCEMIETKTYPHGPYITPVDYYGIVEGKIVKATSNGFNIRYSDLTWFALDPAIPVKKTAKRFDLVCRLQFNTYRGKRMVEFRNVSPSNLPLIKKVGPVTVTLERAYYGNAPKGHPHFSEAKRDKFFVLMYSVSGPADNFNAKFELKKDGWTSENTSLAPYWHNCYSRVRVSDESGNPLNSRGGEQYEASSGASSTFEQEIDRRTTMESLMKILNRKAASNMITNRALQKARTHPRKFKEIIYYLADSAPKRFTFKTEVNTAPTRSKSYTVIFKNIPVPSRR